jgi:glutamine amidotransferase
VIAVVDLGISNLESVLEALRRVGAAFQVTTDPGDIDRADAVILPGVGAFGDGMRALREHRLVEPLRRHVRMHGRALAGICLGMQLLADAGEEHGLHEGLGLVPGRSARLEPRDRALRVPNMGWCDVTVRRKSTLFDEGDDGRAYYFAHSYHVVPNDPADVTATLEYGGEVAAAIERGSVLGLQFHPEKSQDAGLAVLDSFARIAA